MPDEGDLARELDLITARVLAGDIPATRTVKFPPTALTTSAAVMKCDICGTVGSDHLISASQMRTAVLDQGFDPFMLGLFSKELLDAVGVHRAKAYRDWLPLVRADETDWNLCSACGAALQPYVARSAQAATSQIRSGRSRTVWIVLGVLAAIALVAVILSSSGPRPSTASAPSVDARSLVRQFYDDVSAKRWDAAYSLLGSQLRTEEPRDTFDRRYHVDSIDIATSDLGNMQVSATVIATPIGGGEKAVYQGTITVGYDDALNAYAIESRDMHRVSGPNLIGP